MTPDEFAKDLENFLNGLVPYWSGFGPWVDEADLTPIGVQVRREFLRMLTWDARAIPHLKAAVAELEKRQTLC